MADITLNLGLNIAATIIAFLFGLEVFVPWLRRLPNFYWRKFTRTDPFSNIYGKFICYRLTRYGQLTRYSVTVRPGYGADPICIWENKETSSPAISGKVIRFGSKYALLFDKDPDRLPTLILLHAEGPASAKRIKMGIHTGVLAADPSTIFSGSVLLSRTELVSPERFLSATKHVLHSEYVDACDALGRAETD